MSKLQVRISNHGIIGQRSPVSPLRLRKVTKRLQGVSILHPDCRFARVTVESGSVETCGKLRLSERQRTIGAGDDTLFAAFPRATYRTNIDHRTAVSCPEALKADNSIRGRQQGSLCW